MPMPRMLLALIAAPTILFLPLLAPAMALEPAKGPVVLTIVGDMEDTNRPASQEAQDPFFAYHDRSFTAAAEFDRGMLEGLGTQSITIDVPGVIPSVQLEGPWLSDVLTAVGGEGKDITVLALDGFGSEIAAADLDRFDWLLALKQDGRYLGLGQRGPTWLVYSRRDGKPLTEEDELRWPWASFLIEIK